MPGATAADWLHGIGIDPRRRPETLTIAEFARLAERLRERPHAAIAAAQRAGRSLARDRLRATEAPAPTPPLTAIEERHHEQEAASVASKHAARSLHIGLNAVAPAHYGGWSGPLAACEFDANDMADIARSRGMRAKVLLTKAATRAKVLAGIRAAASRLKKGDLFLPDLLRTRRPGA